MEVKMETDFQDSLGKSPWTPAITPPHDWKALTLLTSILLFIVTNRIPVSPGVALYTVQIFTVPKCLALWPIFADEM